MPQNTNSAFTLIETLLSISILVILLSLPISLSFLSINSFDLNSDYILAKSVLTKARSQAINNLSDSEYGVKINSNNIILFKGASFSTRDTNFDDTYDFKSSLTGTGEIVFLHNTGFIINDASITITNGSNNKNIVINTKGSVD